VDFFYLVEVFEVIYWPGPWVMMMMMMMIPVEQLLQWMSGRGNRSTRIKLSAVLFWPPQIPHMTSPGLELEPRRWELTTNRLSYGTLDGGTLLVL
jgi:hypothetical protein